MSVPSQSGRLYEQVYNFLLRRIERGEWGEHDKLPSVRSLAQEMNVNRLTVFKAYQLLKQNKKVYAKDKSGYYVYSDHSQQSFTDPSVISTYIQKNPISDIQRRPVTYQFSRAIIDPNLLPNHYFAEYVKKVFDLYPKVLGSYASVQGDEELRRVLADYFSFSDGLSLSLDEMLITTGAQQAINLIAEVLIKPGDPVLIERPTYGVAIDIFRQKAATILPVDIHPDGYDMEQVEYLMKKNRPRLFYINPTFHNPTGYVLPAGQRKRLVELAEKFRCLIVEDDPFHDIYFDHKPPPSLFSYDTAGCVFYIRSFSKYVSPGLRIAAAICRHPLMNQVLTAKSLADDGSPLLNQKIFLHYFLSSRLQRHLEKLRIALSLRKEFMEEELFATNWKWKSPKGGLSLWVKLPNSLPVDQLLNKSLKQSVSFVPGVHFDPLKREKSWIRLTYSYMNEQKSREGLRRLIKLAAEGPETKK